MITVEQKQAIIETAFNNARGLDELRWLNGIFANILASLPLLNQFQLSDVLESRVTEVQGVDDAGDQDEVGHGPRHVEAGELPGDRGEENRPQPQPDYRSAPPLHLGSTSDIDAQGGG